MSTQLAVVDSAADEPTTALAVAKPREILPPETAYRQMRAMADDLFKSGLMPPGIRNWQSAFAVMQKGRELGIPPMAAIEGISIVKGKPTCGAHLMLALVKRDYGPGAIRVAQTSNEGCTVEWREQGWAGTSHYTYTMADARTAGLADGDTWKKYPAAMLRARCISAVVKMAFAECVGGMMLPEELGASVTVDGAGEVVIVDPGGQPQRPAARPSPAFVGGMVTVEDVPEEAESAPVAVAVGLPLNNGPAYLKLSDGSKIDAQTGEILDAESRVIAPEPEPEPPRSNVDMRALHADIAAKLRTLEATGDVPPGATAHGIAHDLCLAQFGLSSLTMLEPKQLRELHRDVGPMKPDELIAAWHLAQGDIADRLASEGESAGGQ